MEATTAADRERDDYALSFFQSALLTRLDDLAHEFVPQHIARFHTGYHAVIKMQVAAADRGRGDADDRIAGVDDFGVRHRVDADVFRAMPCKGLHAALSWYFAARVSSRRLAEVAISPVSISILNRLRSCRAWICGSRRKALAIALPRAPAGGS